MFLYCIMSFSQTNMDDIRRRNYINDFLTYYQEAYEKHKINFIEDFFSSNALIITETKINPAKRNVLDLKNETCKNREKRNVLKISHTRHFKTTKKQSKTGCFYSF